MSGFQLTNYWLLLVWLALAGIFMTYFVRTQPTRVLGKTEQRWPVPAAVILAIPYIIWAANRRDFGDTEVYRQGYADIAAGFSNIGPVIVGDGKDKGFTVLEILIKTMFGDNVVLFFFLVATFQLLCVFLVFRHYSSHMLISIFLFVASTDYLSWCMNGMRQFIAAAGIFACTGLLLKKKFIPTIIVILLMSTIHGTALLMLPVVFLTMGKAWNKRTVLATIVLLIAIAYIGRFTTILQDLLQNTQYEDVVNDEIWSVDNGTTLIRDLVYSVPALLSLLGRRYIAEADDPVINLSVNMSILSAGLYLLSAFTSGIYIGRLPIYMSLYGYILLPWLLDHMLTRESSRVAKGMMIVLYLLFFYYQMHTAWHML